MKYVKLYEAFLNEEANYPAQFEIGDSVSFKTKEDEDEQFGSIVKVSFTKAKVFYDILDDYSSTVISEVDSAFVKPIKRQELTEPANEAKDDSVTLNVTISNIDQSTADDFLKMFAFMEYCGNVGTSRTMRGFLDGDGHFRPDIKVEGIDLKKIDLGLTDDNKEIDLDLDFGA